MKQVPFVNFPKGKKMDSPPPDGVYATISHNPGLLPRALVPNPFPWRAEVYEFKGGIGNERGIGSDIVYILIRYNVAKVYLINITDSELVELNKKLGKHYVELIPDPAVEAEAKRARDSFGPGFPLPV